MDRLIHISIATCLLVLTVPAIAFAQGSPAESDESLREAFEKAYQSSEQSKNLSPELKAPAAIEQAALPPRLARSNYQRESPESSGSTAPAPKIPDSMSGSRNIDQGHQDPQSLTAVNQPADQPVDGNFPITRVRPESQPPQPILETGRGRTVGSSLITQHDNSMWWQSLVTQPLDQRKIQEVSPGMLIHIALQNSPKILATSKRPLIQETEIDQARAEFDADLFLRTQFDDRVDPVGNTLSTDGLPFLEDNIWYGDSGLRRKFTRGGEVEVKQRLGFQNSNGRFFDPQDQGTATLSMNFTQPLLRGRGTCFNRSQIVIAQVTNQASWDQFAAELQDELTEVVEAYWTLYYHRAVLLQKQYNVERGDVVLKKLVGRSGLDSLPSQIARARAAVQSRRTELANARRDVRNAETEIRRRIGSAENFQAVASEIIPMEPPTLVHTNTDLASVIGESMQTRPEVKQAIKRARIAAVQKNVSQHELLPELNLVFNTYVSALRGESQVLESWADQFNSTPGYGVGFEFALPAGRRAARARNTRQQLVVDQVRHDIDQAVHEVAAEAQVAWRQVDSAYQTALAAAEAIRASRADLLQNEARWESFALVEGDLAEGQTPTTLLDQLLDAQQRLTNAELTYSQAILEFKTAEIGLKRASGVLLNFHQVNFGKGDTDCGPVTHLD